MNTAVVQLSLVQASPPARKTVPIPGASAAVVRVFEHWVLMMGKNPKRCALGPTRRKVIERALRLYDEDTLCLAIEGCAASEFHRGENDRGREYTDIELILRDEAHVERFADDGQALRDKLEEQERRQQQRAAAPAAQVVPAVNAAEVAEKRRKLAELAARMAGRAAR